MKPNDYPNSEKLNQNIHGFRDIQQVLQFLDTENIRLVTKNTEVPIYSVELVYQLHFTIFTQFIKFNIWDFCIFCN